MPSRLVFISHAWDEDQQYRKFLLLLDEALGSVAWTNLSIPQDEALRLTGIEKSKDELARIDAEITQLQARLDAGNLPDVCERIVWDAQGKRREEPTRGTVGLQLTSALSRRQKILTLNPIGDESASRREALMSKGQARQINLHPDLSLAIRERIIASDIVFVLVTPMCRFRTWIDFEIACATNLRVPVVAVLAGGTQTRNLSIDFDYVVPLDLEILRSLLIRNPLRSVCAYAEFPRGN
jgi:hypothetical protein